MTNRVCSVEGCGKPHLARGWCGMHYARNVPRKRVEKPCCVEGCDRIVSHGGVRCPTHQARLRKYGTTDRVRPPGRPARAAIDRFLDRVTFSESTCWGSRCLEWTGARTEDGYGRFGSHPKPGGRSYVSVPAHRWLYERWVGRIPEGLHLDHLCRNPPCVNPAHLEPVTPAENSRRGRVLRSPETHCPHGALLSNSCKSCSDLKLHGTRGSYGRGCRCDDCRAAERDYAAARRSSR